MDLISTFSDSIEIYSVDECFISINEKNNLIEFGQHIKNEVWRQQRMPVCVGIAETKTLAKLANHIAKKSKRLNGVCLIEDITKWDAVFKKLHVSKIWGVGSRITARLALMGVNTVYDLIRQPSKRIRKEFGVTLERTVNELNGEKCFDLETEPKPKKEIMTYKSFGTKTKDLNILKGYLACFVSTAVEKLNKQIGLTSCISVTIETSRFDVKSYKRGATIMLPYPTNDLRIITRYALFVCEKLFMSDYLYVRAGIGLYDLSNSEQTQYDLFEKGQTVKAYKLMEVMNTVNDRYGRNQIYLGAQGTKNKWSLVGAYKSPSYTTRFSDIPIIKI
jgi:DNA polymerase V